MPDILSDFSNAIRAHGLMSPERIVSDGKIHRFRSGPEKAENGFYRLSLVPSHQGGDIGFGLIGCWKRGLNEKWCSKERAEITPIDRAVMQKALTEHKAESKKDAAEAARKAEWIWKKRAFPASADHPYLVAKGISPRGLKEYKGSLVVSVYCDGTLTSLQFIDHDGGKKFLGGGRIDGGYASISGQAKDRGRIVIAEGYATAASLHEATGLPCVAAFSAGNLLPVAKAMRAKYPDAELILGADNDRLTKIQGKPINVGVNKGVEAAAAVGASVTWPEFPEGMPDSDWDDYSLRYGKEATSRAFFERAIRPNQGQEVAVGEGPQDAATGTGDAHSTQTDEPPAYVLEPRDYAGDGQAMSRSAHSMGDWRSRLIQGKEVAEGHPYPFERKSKTNAFLFLKYHPLFAGMLCYNEFSDAVMIMRRPPWDEAAGDFSPRHIRDDDFFMMAAHLEYCMISVAKDTAADAAIRVAKENTVNPPREYLAKLQWDGKGRLDWWLTYYLGADEQPAEYLALVGSKWMIGAVSRVFEPGCKFDSVLILEGTQGLGKSMALRSLSTFNGQDFFLDSVGDIRSKDTLMTMQGKLIVEIAELASFRKTENEEIKAFITRQVDEYRPPYGRTVIRRPRYFVLAGSTNEIDDGYLTDDTGNRRYWPVKCKGIDSAAIAVDAEQLWAEAVVRYHAGERTWLATEESAFSTHEQKSRFVEDAWQDRIAGIVRHEFAMRIDDILTKLDLKPRDINNMTKKRVKSSLKQLGWHETRRSGEGRVWRPIGIDAAPADLVDG